MFQKVVDLVDLGCPLIKPPKSKYVHVLNMVDLFDFVILSERMLENLNICMSQNMVDLVEFVFHSLFIYLFIFGRFTSGKEQHATNQYHLGCQYSRLDSDPIVHRLQFSEQNQQLQF